MFMKILKNHLFYPVDVQIMSLEMMVMVMTANVLKAHVLCRM